MDVIQQCLSLAPVPYLAGAFGLLKSISDIVQQMKTNKLQLQELAGAIASLLFILNDQYQRKETLEAYTSDALGSLESLLRDVLAMIQKYQSSGIFKMFFIKDDIKLVIDSYNERIAGAFRNFQITAALDIQALQKRSADACAEDHQQLLSYMHKLESNQNLIMAELHINQMDPTVTMVALQKRIDIGTKDLTEREIVQRSLTSIEKATKSKKHEVKSWTFTPLELAMGDIICEGGFGTVYKAKWRGTDVAVKKLKNSEGVTAQAKDLKREIGTWSTLLHPNILQFLGANTLVNDPFIVMPLIKHGNVRDYLQHNPQCDRVKIIHQISLGIVYLHSRSVIHGDLKAANVLIDDGEKAVLCDFGLSRIKEDVASRSPNKNDPNAQGSLYWMAPERLNGSLLRKPCDIYSFAITMYEVYTDTLPLAGVQKNDFREVVAVQNRRPERPSDDEAPQLTDDGWQLMERCWAPVPKDRPEIDSVACSLNEMTAANSSLGRQSSTRMNNPSTATRRSNYLTNDNSESDPSMTHRTQTNRSAPISPSEIQQPPSVLGGILSSDPESMWRAEETPGIWDRDPEALVRTLPNNDRAGYPSQQRPQYAQAHGPAQNISRTLPPQPTAPQPHNAYNPYVGPPLHGFAYANDYPGNMRPCIPYQQQVPNGEFDSTFNSHRNLAAYANAHEGFVGGFRPLHKYTI